MELLILFAIFAGFGVIGWIYEQVQEYFERERSRQRDEIAATVLSDSGITGEVKETTEKLFSYVVKSIPNNAETTEPYEIMVPQSSRRLGQVCPKCHSGIMVTRHGKYGSFLGCIRYPHCDSTKQIGWVNKEAKDAQKDKYSKMFMEDLKKAYN